MDLKHGCQKLVRKRVWSSYVSGVVIAQGWSYADERNGRIFMASTTNQAFFISNYTSLILTFYINGINIDNALRCKQK